MKSLASEVAAKHDEVCQLQSQLVALDEVVQTARQKLILKDKCIAQLNQQVRGARDQVDFDYIQKIRFANIRTCAFIFEISLDENT